MKRSEDRILTTHVGSLIRPPDLLALGKAAKDYPETQPRYEEALVNNDVDALIGMFWASPHTIRFGATENLYGLEEINAFRKGRSPVNLARTIDRLDIATFGHDFGEISLEFSRPTGTGTVRGRQSQTWVRFPEGWRIVAAHISLLAGAAS